MANYQRQKEIFDYLVSHGFASAEELAPKLGTSSITIRREFISMEKQGLLTRQRGGARPAPSATFNIPMAVRLQDHADQKKRIATVAASMLKDGETIFLDAGSTCRYFADMLPDTLRLRIITHSPENLNALRHKNRIEVICPGGQLDRDLSALVGPITERALQDFFADTCFLGVSRINLEQGCVNNKIDETNIKRIMHSQSRRHFILADSSKFGLQGFHRSLSIPEIQGAIITDSNLDPEQKEAYVRLGVTVIVA